MCLLKKRKDSALLAIAGSFKNGRTPTLPLSIVSFSSVLGFQTLLLWRVIYYKDIGGWGAEAPKGKCAYIQVGPSALPCIAPCNPYEGGCGGREAGQQQD